MTENWVEGQNNYVYRVCYTLSDGTCVERICEPDQICKLRHDVGPTLMWSEQLESRVKKTWREALADLPLAREFAKTCPTPSMLLDAILSTNDRRQQLAMIEIAGYAWNGDEGNGTLLDSEICDRNI